MISGEARLERRACPGEFPFLQESRELVLRRRSIVETSKESDERKQTLGEEKC